MKTPKGSLCRLIKSKFGFDPSSNEFYAVFAHTLSYLTRGISYAEYQERLKPFCHDQDFSAKDFRLVLHATEYFGLRIKLYVFRLGKQRRSLKAQAKAFAAEYGLFNCDAIRIFRFWNEQRRFRTRIKKLVRPYHADIHLNLDVLKMAMNEVLKPVNKKIKSFTYKKLRFICKSQNIELADLHAELQIKAVNAYHKLMPCTMEPMHVVNYLKRAVHNAGVNLIGLNTSQKAGRLVNNDATGEKRDSFSLLVVSENQMRITADSDPVSYEELAGHNPIERFEIEHSVGKLVSSVKAGGKKHRFLTILMGDDDHEFTEWLQVNRYATNKESNSDLQERIDPTRFNILVGRFLRVSGEKINTFLSKLKSSLGSSGDFAFASAA